VLAPHIAQPLLDGFSATPDARIANSHVLGKGAFFSHCLHLNAVPVVFKLQFIACAHAQSAPYISRQGDLSFAGQLRLSLHKMAPIPYFITFLLTSSHFFEPLSVFRLLPSLLVRFGAEWCIMQL
jgi:hypothetical protein